MAAPQQPHELTIRIINANGNGGAGAGGGNPSHVTGGGRGTQTAQNAINGAIIARELRSIGRQVTSYAVSNVSLVTGNTISQERLEFGMNAAGKLAAYGTALATGNFVAAGIMAINDALTLALNADRLRRTNAVERESLALSRDRAGVAFNYSRMGGAK